MRFGKQINENVPFFNVHSRYYNEQTFLEIIYQKS